MLTGNGFIRGWYDKNDQHPSGPHLQDQTTDCSQREGGERDHFGKYNVFYYFFFSINVIIEPGSLD